MDALFALRCRVRASNLIFVYCRLEYIKLGFPQDSTWRDFPQALAEMQGVRQYVTLFEAPFVASELEGRESQAIRTSSLTAIPPPPPGLQPLPGAPLADLAGQNLAQWADRVQEVTSHMRMPPRVAVECPTCDIIEVLNRLENMTWVRYCRHCFGVGSQCRCSVMPRQALGATTSLWSPPVLSYAAMASPTDTIASTSTASRAGGTSGMPPLEAMDTSPPLSTASLLLTAGVGRGARGWTPPRAPTTPGPCQSGPRAPPPQMPTSEGQGAAASTPYKWQVTPPMDPTPGQSTTPCASRSKSRERPAGKETRPQGRSASRGAHGRQRASRSSTRGSSVWRSRKHCWAAPDDDLEDEMSNYVASGWRRDLVHFIGCCWAAQVGSLEEEGWHVAISKFLAVMAQRKKDRLDLKELTPLRYMPYMALLFQEVTGKDLQGLNRFTGWIGRGGYYHWRLVQQGLIHHVPQLQDDPPPKVPKSHPSGRPLPARLHSARTQAPKTTTWPPGQPTSSGGGSRPASDQGSTAPTTSQGGRPTTSSQHRKSTPATSGGPTDQSTGGAGAGDGPNWYQTAIREARGKISKPEGPPFPVALAEVRQRSVGQIYGQVVGKQPPKFNIFSRGLQAYYTRVDASTLDTWACQALCMVAEYHLACVTRGSAITSPILPGELEECLPPLAGYLPPEDQTGATDVRVRDNWARTLRVAMWCHRLDMVVSDPNSSRSLIKARHQMGVLLAYFLGPGTAWKLTFEDVIAQVLKENHEQLDAQRNEAVASLHHCNRRRASLCREIDASAVAQELTANTPEGRELTVKLTALQMALGAVEKAMTAHENLIEKCRLQEEEARQASHEEPKEEFLDEEMEEDDDWDDPEPSDPHAGVDKENSPPPLEEANPAPQEPQSDVITPEEDALLMQPASLSGGPDTGSHSPRSEASTVSGELAGLSIASPGPTEPMGDETPQ